MTLEDVNETTSRLSSLSIAEPSETIPDLKEIAQTELQPASNVGPITHAADGDQLDSDFTNEKPDISLGVSFSKAERKFLRAQGLNNFEILGLMRSWPRESSVSSMFVSSLQAEDGYSNSNSSAESDLTAASSCGAPSSVEGSGYGLSHASQPVSAVPSAPRMKPKRASQAPGASTLPPSPEELLSDHDERTALIAVPDKLAEAERQRIKNNYSEFLSMADARRAAEIARAEGYLPISDDPEVEEFEAIFLEGSDKASSSGSTGRPPCKRATGVQS